jgi:hypothetical protein
LERERERFLIYKSIIKKARAAAHIILFCQQLFAKKGNARFRGHLLLTSLDPIGRELPPG